MERYRLPIPWDAVPIEHRPPYRRIEPTNPSGYQKRISWFEVQQQGGRHPDPRKYKLDDWSGDWLLREEFH